MSQSLVDITLTKLGFKASDVVSKNQNGSKLKNPTYSMKPQDRLHIQNSLLGGYSAPQISTSSTQNSKLDTVLRKAPALQNLYQKLKPLAPIVKAISDRKFTIPFKNDKSKSLTFGHVDDYKNYVTGERDTLKRLGHRVMPNTTPLYGIKFTKRF